MVAKEGTTFRRLQAFAAVDATGNWKQAASVLRDARETSRLDSRSPWNLVQELAVDLYGSNPPTLFRSVRVGERRAGRSVELTPSGRKIAPKIRQIVATFESLCAEARGSVRPLHLSCYPAHMRVLIASLMAAIDDDLVVEEADDTYRANAGQLLFEQLRERETDLVVAPLRTPRARSGISSQLLYEWRLTAIIPRALGRTLDQAHPLLPEHIKDSLLLLSPEGHSSRVLVDAAYKAAGVTPVVGHESNNTESLLALVDAGYGIAILPGDAVWKTKTRTLLPFGNNIGGKHGLHWRQGEDRRDDRLRHVIEVARRLRSEKQLAECVL